MRTPRTTPTEVIRADWWGPTESVTIKTYLSGWDKVQMRAHLKRARAAAEQEGVDEDLLDYEMALRYLEYGITAVALTFADGTPVQQTMEDYRRLDDRDVAFIGQALKDRLDQWQRTEPAGTEEDRRKERFPAEQARPAGPPGKTESAGPPARGGRSAAAV